MHADSATMIFARLLESQRAALATRAMIEGAGASAMAHLLLIAGWIVLHPHVVKSKPDAGPLTSPVEFLMPRDRIAGTRPQQETVTFTSLLRGTGSGFAAETPKKPSGDEPRLEIVVPRGRTNEVDLAMKAFESRPALALGDSIMLEFQVDSAVVRYEDGAAPSYPDRLLKRHIEGFVIVQYVVDTLGRADTATFRVLSATHSEFAKAVKAALPQMRFRPAVMASRLVRQLVQQPFAFRIIDTTKALVRRSPGSDPTPSPGAGSGFLP